MSNDIPIKTIETDDTKKIAKCFNEEIVVKRQRRMNATERHDFIIWMFENLDTFDQTKARWVLAKDITTTYRSITKFNLNIDWVAALLKYGICQYEDGSLGFKEKIDYTVDDLCRSPSLIRLIKLE